MGVVYVQLELLNVACPAGNGKFSSWNSARNKYSKWNIFYFQLEIRFQLENFQFPAGNKRFQLENFPFPVGNKTYQLENFSFPAGTDIKFD